MTNVLITGASSGVGEAIAIECAKRGAKTLFLGGRNTARLEDVASRCRTLGATVHTGAVDVTDERAMRDWIERSDATAPIDLVFANAGVATGIENEANTRRTFATNVGGVLNCAFPAIDCFRRHGGGQLVLTASIAGYAPLSGCPAYSGTKACVKTWGLAMRGMLAKENIKVNVVCPGFIRSRITDANTCPMPFFMEAPKAAHIIVGRVLRDVPLIAFPWPMRLAVWSLSVLPARLSGFIASCLPAKVRKQGIITVATALLALCAFADTQTINGVTYVCEDGVCRMVAPPAPTPALGRAVSPLTAAPQMRISQGFQTPEQFLAFLSDDTPPTPAGDSSRPMAITLLLILLGGLAMNLTPCVLPMIPVNLIVIGRSWKRGLAYGLGQTLSYGALGIAAAIGGLAFGTIQSSPWFNSAVAIVFASLALSLFGVFTLDFSRFRPRVTQSGRLFAPFALGALTSVLAGACLAPILVSVLLLTASLYAKGHLLALSLPFVLGLGLALPWPFLAAGLRVLPKPGAWMRWVNRLFAIVVLGLACWYARLAFVGWTSTEATAVSSSNVATPETYERTLAALQSKGKPILVDCWATWCKNCAAMEHGTLRDERVASALADFEILRLQAEDIRALQRLPGFSSVRGLPAFAIIPAK